MREALSDALSSWGCAVWTAESVAAACRVAETADLDAVLSDVDLPGDGLTLARRLHVVQPHVPVILITGADDDAARARDTGAFEFLTKPLDLNSLRATLSRAFGRRHLG